ncbi:hypothetical protein ILUMI_01854 [Ignelater luminosus]|uniref:C2H2-type domain-containing protein n=1 Tax=Ignelater luminosus TaxID=2038154 RepID=A0A8K0DJ89_IGNLU|nr:hypothetical protein ILUMI_01854 [Ignelater luminosus]
MESNKCQYCCKKFSNGSSRNRHIKNIHNEVVKTSRIIRIKCSLCFTETGTYETLKQHLTESHQVSIDEIKITFSSKNEVAIWLQTEKIEVNYFICRRKQKKNVTEIQYACNRSDLKGHKSNCKIRTEKTGGSIKIQGVCPSHLIIKFYKNGQASIKFWKTHVGHDEEIRTQHLSRVEKNMIVDKLKIGISVDQILDDVRKVEHNKQSRFNLASRKDINYLTKKHNIDKRRHENYVVAIGLKVQEWKQNGKNYAFFFKQEGESHPVLKDTDFAVGFMNATMEKKLKDFGKIICMDGTHCTNRKEMDLTIMFVKDDKNAEFPVAFFLTNRLDQVAQEIFLDALKEKVGEELQPEYFMTDDDPKYYNAWIKVMKSEPRRLLCSWHVIKDWNLQGRNKIKNAKIKKTMKSDLKKILYETRVNEFIRLSNEYFDKLKKAQEIDFLDYLQKYYFGDQKRINLWAHCFILGAGINTNTTLESLNNLLKTNQIKSTNITVETLLDKIGDLVDSKMWQRISNMERPNANSYQGVGTLKGHKTAEQMNRNLITEVELGEFQEKEGNSVLGDVSEALDEQRKEIENFYQEEIQDVKETIDEGRNEVEEAIRRRGNEEILNALNELDFESYSKKFKAILKLIKQDDTNIDTNKRKIEKQEYFPTKKRC